MLVMPLVLGGLLILGPTPTPTPAPTADAMFIATARSADSPDRASYAGLPDPILIQSARGVCAALKAGGSITDEVAKYEAASGHSRTGGVFFVGLSMWSYCPAHLPTDHPRRPS